MFAIFANPAYLDAAEEARLAERADRERALRAAGYHDAHVATVLARYDDNHPPASTWRHAATQARYVAPVAQRMACVAMPVRAHAVMLATAAMLLP